MWTISALVRQTGSVRLKKIMADAARAAASLANGASERERG